MENFIYSYLCEVVKTFNIWSNFFLIYINYSNCGRSSKKVSKIVRKCFFEKNGNFDHTYFNKNNSDTLPLVTL